MKKIFLIIILFVFNIACNSQNEMPNINTKKINTAVESSKKWLAIIDSSMDGESWETSSELFRKSVSKENWITAIDGIRSPLGKVISRELEREEYKTSLPGVPDGEYVIIVYRTEFENKEKSYETITPMKDKDGTWRISGYYIK